MKTDLVEVADFQKFVANGEKGTVCIFSASWCGPCVGLKKKIGQAGLEKELESSVQWCVVDVDEAEDLAQKFEVQAMPTIIFFDKSGELKGEKIVGANYPKIEEAAKAL